MDIQTKNLTCTVCQDIYKEPVLLTCSHSFCKDCLKSWWREMPTQECPVCRRRSSRSDPPRNLALRNLCEDYVQVQDLKDELDKYLLPLKKNLQRAKKLMRKIKKKTAHIKKQFHQTERQIKDEFLKLHQFLEEEEESRMMALREEEKQKTQRMKDKMAAVSREIEALSESIRATEEQLIPPDVSSQLKYKAAEEKVQHCPLLEEEPQLGPGALIDHPKHLGNLTFNIWTNMKKLVYYTPVILDPNRALNAVLSDDLTSFTFENKEINQGSCEDDFGIVFGSEGFGSGSHSWEVEVGDNEWVLGVAPDCATNDEDPEVWAIGFLDGEYDAETYNEDNIYLKLVSNLKKFRVCLDCDKHDVSFYDLDTNVHIHTFTQITLKELFPFFLTSSKSTIRILPQTGLLQSLLIRDEA